MRKVITIGVLALSIFYSGCSQPAGQKSSKPIYMEGPELGPPELEPPKPGAVGSKKEDYTFGHSKILPSSAKIFEELNRRTEEELEKKMYDSIVNGAPRWRFEYR